MDEKELRRFCDPGPLRVLYPILNEWCSLMERQWLGFGPNDAPWWYNERASLSVFAGAVWKSGGHAFEEYSITKKYGKKNGAGRADIWIQIGRKIFVGEAKQSWPIVTRQVKHSLDIVTVALDEACKESRRAFEKGTRVGLVFVSPRIRKTKENGTDELLQTFLTAVRAKYWRSAAIVWSFPRGRRYLSNRDNLYSYPGCLLIVRRARGKRTATR